MVSEKKEHGPDNQYTEDSGKADFGMGKASEYEDNYDYDDDLGDLDVETIAGDDAEGKITGDPDVDFADSDVVAAKEKREGGASLKMLAPVFVLLIAAGVGGFIVMNPQVLGGGKGGAKESAPVAVLSPMDITEQQKMASAPTPMFDDSLPQPTGTQNETPRPPEPLSPVEVAEAPSGDAGLVAMEGEGDASFLGDDEVIDSRIVAQEAPAAGMEEAPTEMPVTTDQKEAGAAHPDSSSGPVEEIKPFKVAQAIIEEAPKASPPKMPEQKAAPNVTTPPPAPQTQAMENASGAAANPVRRTDAGTASDNYFDGRIPTGPMAAEAGPRKVDPVMEPASQFVVVKKSYGSKDMEAVLVSANRALDLKRYSSALDMFSQLYEKNPRDPRILMGKAVAQQNVGMTEPAIRTYEELLEIDPKNTGAMLNMLGLIREQYPEVALRRLMDLYDRYPDNAGIAAQIGVTQADLSHFDDALRYLGVAASLEPQNAQHIFNMAIVADRAGRAADAISFYERALELDAVHLSGASIPRESVYDRLSVLRRR